VALTRNEVKLEEQAAQKKTVDLKRGGESYKIGIIELPAFYMDFNAANQGKTDYKSSTRDVEALLTTLNEEGVDGIVVDLRGNAGGSLQEACELTGLFLGSGPVVQVRDTSGRIQVIRNPKVPSVYKGPLVVLVNRLSASASEIFAGAIQDTGRGLIVGSRTFGKGTVQSMAPLEQGQLKVTKAKYYRISGGSTQNLGVEPDLLFPAVYDPEEIGESAIEEALPWDKILSAKYKKRDPNTLHLPELNRLHAERIAEDPEFVFFTERLAYFTEASNKTTFSLNEAVRKQERETMESDLLALENKRRKALGKELVAHFDDLADLEPEPREALDPFAKEAANVLADLIQRLSKGLPQ